MRSGAPPALPFLAASLAAAVWFAGYAVDDPSRFLLLPGLAGVALVAYASFCWPLTAISLTPALILLADTKFRWRDPSASLRGELDAQVMLEIGVYALAGLIVAIVTERRSLRPYPSTLMEGMLFVAGGLAVLSTLWSSAPRFTLVRGTQLLIVYAVGRTVLQVHGPSGTLRILTRTILPYVFVCSVTAVLVPATVLLYQEPGSISRFTWFGVWPTQAARFVALAALLVVAEHVYPANPARRRTLGLPSLAWAVPLSGLLLLTYSRTALAAFVVAVGAVLAVKYLRVWRATLIVGAAAVAALVFVNSGETLLSLVQRGTESDSFLATVLFRGQTVEQLSRLSNRMTLWDGVWQLFLERPLLGYGYQGSRAFLLALMPWAGHAHNALAQASLDLGIIGTVPVVVGLARCLSPRRLRLAGPLSPVVGWRATVFALGFFLLVVSTSAESFAEPSFEALLFVTCVLARELIVVRHRAVAPAHPTRAAPRTLTVPGLAERG